MELASLNIVSPCWVRHPAAIGADGGLIIMSGAFVNILLNLQRFSIRIFLTLNLIPPYLKSRKAC